MIASQLKFATTALCTSVMLKRVIGLKRWISLGTLSLGVILVQLAGQSQQASAASSGTTAQQVVGNAVQNTRSYALGISCIVVACFISGFASIFLEKILKNGNTNLWATNIQLAFFGFIPATLPLFVDAWQNGLSHPFLYFGGWAWTTVGANVLGGLVVALIMKYADNIQKSLAISASIVLTFLITVALGRAAFQPKAMTGSAIVIGSILAYNYLGQPAVVPVKEAVEAPQRERV
jgi:UDP-sugar transporter A1/2/3